MGLRRFGGPGMHGIGGTPLSSLGGAFHGGYFAEVLATGPIATWPLWEASGTVAQCLVSTAQNGTYSSDVSGWPPGVGIGDGKTAPWFDGTNDYVNINTAAFRAAFNGAEGSTLVWARVNSGAVWTDGTYRFALMFYIDANNYIDITRWNANNTLSWRYAAGGVGKQRTKAGLSTTDWMCLGSTWSASANEFRAYYNGVQEGLTINGLGVWSGAALTRAVIGAAIVTPANVWHGWEAYATVWNQALPPATMAALATI